MRKLFLHDRTAVMRNTLCAMRRLSLLFFWIVSLVQLYGQGDGKLFYLKGDLEMTFPNIYFKPQSTDYAKMPYSVDSCFKYISTHIDQVSNSKYLAIWRDSSETDGLSKKRLQKFKKDIRKYVSIDKIKIPSMGAKQLLDQRTIDKGVGYKQILYLLTLNSVISITEINYWPVPEIDPSTTTE